MAERQYVEGVVVELSKEQLRHYLRMINRIAPESAKAIAESASMHLARLGVARDLSKSRVEAFDGALSMDVGTLLTWMSKIQTEHKRAIVQLVTLDASASTRAGV